ncbi:hypothetical protein CVT24_010829 [Panaeolus cyanescens]|uniref:Uncharacterized protein n=1 Tax=Panaeolus cyanescens TaxID=181874 RepID=A0A409VH61_9AGAR|nr:hypothetical protein CVT24_010829 [Panaeolus cyanescens]
MGKFADETFTAEVDLSCLPVLDESGSNWVFWKDIVYGELISRDLYDNVEGLAVEVLRPVVKDGKTYTATDTEFQNPLEESVAEELVRDWKDWVKNEWSAKTIIFRALPPTVMIEIHNQPTVAMIWITLRRMYEGRVRTLAGTARGGGNYYLIATMFRTRFDASKKNASLRAHFAYMMSLRQQYIESKGGIPDEIFIAALVASLPTDKFGAAMQGLYTWGELTNTELTIKMITDTAYNVWERIQPLTSSNLRLGDGDGAKKHNKRPKYTNRGHMFRSGGGAENVAPEGWNQTHNKNRRIKS